jgi:hypothetical protein
VIPLLPSGAMRRFQDIWPLGRLPALLAVLTLTLAVLITGGTGTTRAYAATSPGGGALDWAETQTGKPYVWGGTGPYGYDCSGLVDEAFLHQGITLPRTTYGMLTSPHLVRTDNPQRGDLAFFGTGHVEIVTVWNDATFGALDTGTLIGWHTYYPQGGWAPTAFYRVIR